MIVLYAQYIHKRLILEKSYQIENLTNTPTGILYIPIGVFDLWKKIKKKRIVLVVLGNIKNDRKKKKGFDEPAEAD